MSQLERLPTELLENIFLYCLNLSLPACSPIIGGKLSSEAIYNKTVVAAFHPTWDTWYGKTTDLDPRQSSLDELDVVGNDSLQVGLAAMSELSLTDSMYLVCDFKMPLGKLVGASPKSKFVGLEICKRAGVYGHYCTNHVGSRFFVWY